LLTQTLIIHIIRTAKIPFLQSRASAALIATTVIICAFGIALPYTWIGQALALRLIALSQVPTMGSVRAWFGDCAGFYRWLRQGSLPILRKPSFGVRSVEGESQTCAIGHSGNGLRMRPCLLLP
jgi:hypothetical protein